MDEEICKQKMREQVDLLARSSFIEYYGWAVKEDGLNLFVEMSPRSNTQKKYTVKVNFDDFPQTAPSYQFHGEWPPVSGMAPGNNPPGICIHGTREFYSYHPEHRPKWDHTKYTLPAVLQFIQNQVR